MKKIGGMEQEGLVGGEIEGKEKDWVTWHAKDQVNGVPTKTVFGRGHRTWDAGRQKRRVGATVEAWGTGLEGSSQIVEKKRNTPGGSGESTKIRGERAGGWGFA